MTEETKPLEIEKVEFIHEIVDDPTPPKNENKIDLLDLLRMELQDHMKVALDLNNKIKEAKTEPKRVYYKKKLKKNNEQAQKVLVAIARVESQKRGAA